MQRTDKGEEYEDVLSSLLILADKLDITKDRLRARYKEFNSLCLIENIEKVDIEFKNNNLKIIMDTNAKISLLELNKHGGAK